MALIFALVACNKNEKPEETQEVKKLPSKVRQSDLPEHEATSYFHYDEQNRLTCAIRGADTIDIFYSANGKLKKWELKIKNGYYDSVVYADKYIFLYTNNGILDYALLLNDNEQMLKRDNGFSEELYTYNENGSWIGWKLDNSSMNLTISNIPAIFRYVNSPEWLLYMLPNIITLPHKMGYMYNGWSDSNGEIATLLFELDVDGYPTLIKQITKKDDIVIREIQYTCEYIPVK